MSWIYCLRKSWCFTQSLLDRSMSVTDQVVNCAA